MFPTRMTLAVMKGKLKGATQGYTLLKRKSEALTKRFREITKRIDEVGFGESRLGPRSQLLVSGLSRGSRQLTSIGEKEDGKGHANCSILSGGGVICNW